MFGDIAKMMEQLPKLDALFAQVVDVANQMLESQKRVEASQLRSEALLQKLAEKVGVELE